MRRSRSHLTLPLVAVVLLTAAATTVGGQDTSEIRCRGGALRFDTVGTRIAPTGETMLTLSLHFSRTWSYGFGFSHWSLGTSACAWIHKYKHDSLYEPTGLREIRFETPANAQLKQKLHGSEVDTSATAAEQYPDARSIPVYMKHPNHLWSFDIVSQVDGYLVAGSHGYFKPPISWEGLTHSPTEFNARKTDRNTINENINAVARAKSAAAIAPKPPPKICELAERARARNSPAAPGLEAKCAAERASKATGR